MGHDDVDLVTNQISRKLWKPVEFSFGPAILNSDVLSLDVAVLAQTLSEPLDASRDSGGGAGTEESYPRDFLRLLRTCYDCDSKQHHDKQDG
jgi:hypothetical protein